MRKTVLIQARLSSVRFPNKMLSPLGGMPLVEFVYRRCGNSAGTDAVAVITSEDKSDDPIFDHCVKNKMEVYRGPLNNVLERYIRAAEYYNSGIICRVCGDSPFVDTELMDKMFEVIEEKDLDYVSPVKGTFIAGLDSEIITLKALKKSLDNGASGEELEHVTLYIKNNIGDFRTESIDAKLRPDKLRDVSLTVDYPKDLVLCNKILDAMKDRKRFLSSDILKILSDNDGL